MSFQSVAMCFRGTSAIPENLVFLCILEHLHNYWPKRKLGISFYEGLRTPALVNLLSEGVRLFSVVLISFIKTTVYIYRA